MDCLILGLRHLNCSGCFLIGFVAIWLDSGMGRVSHVLL